MASFLLVFSLILTSAGADWTWAAEQEAAVVAPGAPVAPLPPPPGPPVQMVNPPPGNDMTPEMKEKMMKDQAAREAAMTPEMRERDLKDRLRMERERFYNDSANSTPPAPAATTTNTATTSTATGTAVTSPANQLTSEMKEKMMKEEAMRREKEHRGNGSSSSNQQSTQRQKISPSDLDNNTESTTVEIVDPRQLRDALRQISDMRRELTRFERQLKKVPNDIAGNKIQELKVKLDTHGAAIKNDQTQEAIQAFFEERLWDDVNVLRAQVELPREIRDIKRELIRLEKTIKLSTFKKWIPLDPASLENSINEIKSALADAEAKLAAGDAEAALDALQPIHEGKHPGEIMGALFRLREINQHLQRIKDEEIRNDFKDLLQPFIEAANQGDFREANQSLNEMMSELQPLLQQAVRGQSRGRTYDDKFSKIKDRIEKKFGQTNQGSEESGGESGPQM